MSKPNLTPEDVAAMTVELYLLTDTELLIEADAVAADFLLWLEGRFDLTPEQIAYISTAPLLMQKFWGHLFAASLISRGPIRLGTMSSNPPPRRIKETRQNFFGSVTYNDDDQELVGSLEVEVEFQLL